MAVGAEVRASVAVDRVVDGGWSRVRHDVTRRYAGIHMIWRIALETSSCFSVATPSEIAAAHTAWATTADNSRRLATSGRIGAPAALTSTWLATARGSGEHRLGDPGGTSGLDAEAEAREHQEVVGLAERMRRTAVFGWRDGYSGGDQRGAV